jgi:alkanesulfonate monooxygenase SsuD/methylene tetrahydromethanopterin reductase-like flavin-dependent oxidoreductase (luciferase family)
MKFGIGPFNLQVPHGSGKPHTQVYREMLEQVELAEELGFDSAWLIEHHFKEDGECPSVLLTAAAMAARTRRIKIGTAMLLLPLHRPVRVAEDVAVLDNIANGRFILGVAAGYRPIEFEGLGEGRKGREARMEEQLEILIKSWTMDSFAYSGKHYQFPEISVMPKPAQKPHPPIWIGASTEGGFCRAAKWADALCSSPRHHLSDLKNHYASYRRYLKEFGRQEACTPVIREVYCAESMKQAEEEGGPGMIYIQAGMYGRWAQVRELKDDRGQAVSGAGEVSLETFRERFILGDPEHCIRKIEKYRREIGMDYLQCMMDFPNVDPELTKKSMRLFAREVMPHFTKSV